jgi:hypothetical protein
MVLNLKGSMIACLLDLAVSQVYDSISLSIFFRSHSKLLHLIVGKCI